MLNYANKKPNFTEISKIRENDKNKVSVDYVLHARA